MSAGTLQACQEITRLALKVTEYRRQLLHRQHVQDIKQEPSQQHVLHAWPDWSTTCIPHMQWCTHAVSATPHCHDSTGLKHGVTNRGWSENPQQEPLTAR